MPGLDGTGPWGEGPMTGGGRGYCNSARKVYGPNYANYGWGRGPGRGRGFRRGFYPGYGRGRGYGRGFGWRAAYPAYGGWYGPPPFDATYAMDPKDEVEILKDESASIKQDLNAIQRRIGEIESQAGES